MGNNKDKKVIERWQRQACEDLKTSKILLREGRFLESAFFSQQAVEKALKALYIKEKGELIRVHETSFLAKKLNLPEKLAGYCEDLDPLYVESRYPDVGERDVSEKEARELLEKAEEVLEWVKKRI